MPKARYTAEEFIKIWISSNSLSEVAEKTGYDPRTLSVRAAQYRKRGVKLPKFVRLAGRSNRDWEKLAELAEKLKAEK